MPTGSLKRHCNAIIAPSREWRFGARERTRPRPSAAMGGAAVVVVGPDRDRVEFLAFLRLTDSEVPTALDTHLVLDNYATHKHPQVQAWLAQHEHCHLHADLFIVAEPDGALVRTARPASDQAPFVPQRQGAGRHVYRVHRRPQRQREAIHPGCLGPVDHREGRVLVYANLRYIAFARTGTAARSSGAFAPVQRGSPGEMLARVRGCRRAGDRRDPLPQDVRDQGRWTVLPSRSEPRSELARARSTAWQAAWCVSGTSKSVTTLRRRSHWPRNSLPDPP